MISACPTWVRAAGADACSRRWLVVFVPCLVVASHHDGAPRLGHQLLDDYLAMVACEINDRPRKILNWKKPSEVFAELVTANASTA